MRTEIIYCPACRHKLRIPEDMLGTEVQCPECKGTFVAPPPAPSDAAPMAVPAPGAMREGAPPREPDYDYNRPDEFEPRRRERTVAPGEKFVVPCGAGVILFSVLSL